jgi:hypothetical protein
MSPCTPSTARAHLAAFVTLWTLVAACGTTESPEFSVRKYADLPLAPADSTMAMLGERYFMGEAGLDPRTRVMVAAWQSETPDARGYSARQFYLNLFVQGVWRETPFTLDDVERLLQRRATSDTTLPRPVLDEDGRPNYYRVLMRDDPEDGSGDVSILRTTALEGHVVNLVLTRTFLGTPAEVETERDQWLRDSGQVWFAVLAGVRPAPTWWKLARP